MKKMYNIEIPSQIHIMIALLYQFGVWRKDDITIYKSPLKLYYCFCFVAFAVSVTIGSATTDDNDERVSLAVISISLFVHSYKIWNLLREQNIFLKMIHQLGTHFTNDKKEFFHVENKLKMFMTLFMYFNKTLICTYAIVAVFPLVNDHNLFFNIAFPLDRSKSDIAFWISFAFVCGALIVAPLGSLLSALLWYLMLGFVLKYNILGSELKNLGIRTGDGGTNMKISGKQQQKLYQKDFIAAIQTYDKINVLLEEFSSTFSNLYFMQIATSSACICGAVYRFAFSSHDDMIQDAVNCIIVCYTFFDIFTVTYLPNEIKLSSNNLSHCLYESNWIEQNQSCKLAVVIVMERLKQPQEIVVGKIYPLNIEAFTTTVNRAYSMFNILQSFRK